MQDTALIIQFWPTMGLLILAYFFGSVSTAIISCRLMGLPDPRTLGSGNPGATNVLRTGNKKAAIITLLGDTLKGFIPVLLAKLVLSEEASWVHLLVGCAAFIGHLFPAYYQFRGGKGVATALGVLLAYYWPVFIAVTATWLLTAWLSRYSALAALTGFALAPFYLLMFGDKLAGVALFLVITALIFWRHQDNIKRLCNGEETKIKIGKE